MPYFNFVERSEQDALVTMLPKLASDLSKNKLDTLVDFKVEWTHVKVTSEPLSELNNLREMSTRAAKGVELQCS